LRSDTHQAEKSYLIPRHPQELTGHEQAQNGRSTTTAVVLQPENSPPKTMADQGPLVGAGKAGGAKTKKPKLSAGTESAKAPVFLT